MNFRNKSIKLAVNPIFFNLAVNKDSFYNFKNELYYLINNIKPSETEEFNKNNIRDFLKKTLYNDYTLNTFGKIDLAIYSGKESHSPISVIIEVKSPSNKNEMVSQDNFSKKAFFELILYYLRQKITNNNHSIQKLIITNAIDWFIFDSRDFERVFARNSDLVNQFKKWDKGLLDTYSTDYFYNEIAPKFINNSNENIDYVHFSLSKFLGDSNSLNIQNQLPDDDFCFELYKLLSPENLLRIPFANDSNSLNKDFYNELLYILGLEEVNEGVLLIKRSAETKRIPGTLIENTIDMLIKCDRLDTDKLSDNDLFEIALELVITWLNRILFLKLLESQIVAFNNYDQKLKFLNSNKIHDFDELNELFFDVLAVPLDKRSQEINQIYSSIPYLNSSLFEKIDYEKKYITINDLKDRFSIPLYSRSILKNDTTEPIPDKISTLHYLLRFLDAYDFGSVGNIKIRKKTTNIINASVLGLIFEKINGYRDGSYFTPGQITMFMARQSIRQAVCDIFRNHFKWNINEFEDIPNYIKYDLSKQKIIEYNKVFNSIKICDPAVGSGHFLVSCLNELVACKHELGILADNFGNLIISDVFIKVENDELVITNPDGSLFIYNPSDKKSSKIQEILFHEKQKIIENCLFGVDINPKSVYITRLRLWIELLKNAYYHGDTKELQTLPNIDINIKIGDSLLSQFALDTHNENSRKFIKEGQFIVNYKKLVDDYKNTTDINKKKKLREEIDNLKLILKNNIITSSNEKHKLLQLKELYHNKFSQTRAFDEQLTKSQIKEKEKLEQQILELENRITQMLSNNSHHYFEWRYEFPEVLDDDGNFTGFDIVIGNPPYISTKDVTQNQKHQLELQYGFADDTYNHFFFRGFELLKNKGYIAYITSKTFWTIQTKKNLRKLLLQNKIIQILDTANPFSSAMVDTSITIAQKELPENEHKIIFTDCKTDFDKPQNYKVLQSVFDCAPNQVFFIPTNYNLKIYERLGANVNQLLNKWWDLISTSKNIEKNKKQLEIYRKNLKPGDITLLGLITEGGQGLATANNGKYIGVLEGTKWAENVRKQRPDKLLLSTAFCKNQNIKTKQEAQSFLEHLSEKEIRKLFDDLKEKYGRDIFGQGWLYRIVSKDEIADVDNLTEDEKLNGIKGEKTFVPYDKGDKDGNRWYAPTPYYIDWSGENVKFLKENSGKKGEGMPVVRNPQFYFREGFCWTFTLNEFSEYQKARIKEAGIHDVNAMSLFTNVTEVSSKYIICLLNSYFLFYYKRTFINSTSGFQINDARQLPIIIPTSDQLKQYENIFDKAYNIQKQKFEGKISEREAEEKLAEVQRELDEIVEEMYMGENKQ